MAVYNEGTLQVGQVIRMVTNGPPFKVESVSPSRAFCTPLNGGLVRKGSDEVESAGEGKSANGVNISPRAYVEIITGDVGEAEKRRKAAMATIAAATASSKPSTTEHTMSASAMPIAGSGSSTSRDRDKERKMARSSRKAAMPHGKLSGAAARSKAKAASNGGAKVRTVSKCKCGCGAETMGNFAPGHDARFHGWMKKIERGEMEPKDLKKAVQDMVGPFKKSGDGFRPSKNYDGSPYRSHA